VTPPPSTQSPSPTATGLQTGNRSAAVAARLRPATFDPTRFDPTRFDPASFDPATFRLPAALEATAPPEARGLARDGVRLLVARRSSGLISHGYFTDLAGLLRPGDVIVVNTSATLPASLEAEADGQPAALHLSGRLPGGLWTVELRHRSPGPPSPGGPDASKAGTRWLAGESQDRSRTTTWPWLNAGAGLHVALPGAGRAVLRMPASAASQRPGPVRLWLATLELGQALLPYLARFGHPIRYSHVPQAWPISAYQTIFAEVPGSAEMPSAARPFSAELITRLVSRGVVVAPFVLHCGVSSPEEHEPPAPEWYRVPATTAAQINSARRSGGRVIAIGTTAVRALETVTDSDGVIHPGEGWTELVVRRDHRITSVDGLLTGWHEPGASHLAMLEAIAGIDLVATSYREALSEGYLWHEFGDSHLVLP
jgi:S-adenosylmethionine:tRNA ribosyltransferase-isomerase